MTVLPRAQLANEVRPQIKQGLVGDWFFNSTLNEYITALNVKPQAYDVWTITVTGFTNSHDYTVTCNTVDVTYTSDSASSIDEVVTGLGAALAGSAAPLSTVATDLGANTITLTSIWPGMANVFTESDGDMNIAHTTSGAMGEDIAFGRVVCSDGYATDGAVKKCYLPKTSYFTAQVATVDYTYQAATVITVEVYNKLDGTLIASAEHIMATDKDTTTTAIAGILNGVAAANTVAFTNDGAATFRLVCTAEVAGLEFEVVVHGAASVVPSVTATTGPSVATSLRLAFLGITKRDDTVPPATLTATSTSYPGNYACTVATKGSMWVTNAQSPTFGAKVYVECDGTSANCGLLYTTSSATRLPLSFAAKWERAALSSSGDSIAVVNLNATPIR